MPSSKPTTIGPTTVKPTTRRPATIGPSTILPTTIGGEATPIERADLAPTAPEADSPTADGGSLQGSSTTELSGESLSWNGKGIKGLYGAAEVLAQALSVIHDRVKCPPEVDGALAVPEWWAVRPGANIPQLAVVLREIDGDGKVLKSQWSFTIPHYIGEAEQVPTIPPFTKGPYFGTLTLADNTKVVINAASTEEAEGVINSIIPYIDPSFLGSQNIHLGLRKGPTLKVATVKPYTAQFYSKGQQDTLPDWTIKFP